jgi:hypothetical protein
VIAVIFGTALVAFAVGWLAGMWTRKRSNLWCPVDGAKLTCSRCTTAGKTCVWQSGEPATADRQSRPWERSMSLRRTDAL